MAMVDRMESNSIPESNSQQVRRGRLGFTLLEVVLAVTIAIGIMVVALYFY
jgi:type II secretory pathway pseudopilin PulG